MCEPTTIAVVGAGIVSTVFAANQQRQQGKFRKGVADYNARVAENQAQEARNVGIEQENMQRRRTAELLSKQRAQLGAAGVELGTGSALQLQEDTIALGEADALRIRSNVERQAGALETESQLTQQQGEFAEQAGQTAATGTLLSGLAQAGATGVNLNRKWLSPDSAAVTGV